jgi:hypothetical protein
MQLSGQYRGGQLLAVPDGIGGDIDQQDRVGLARPGCGR